MYSVRTPQFLANFNLWVAFWAELWAGVGAGIAFFHTHPLTPTPTPSRIRPKASMANTSKTISSRVPIVCWTTVASDERRVDIAPELFFGRSKEAISYRRRLSNALVRVRCASLEFNSAKAPRDVKDGHATIPTWKKRIITVRPPISRNKPLKMGTN
jgi:hypothetical protein